MSYETFDYLCRKNHVKPSDVSKATGIATSTLTSWKKGDYTPKADKLNKIADYFHVSHDCFLPGSETPQSALTYEEQAILSAYRLADESTKTAICKILDIKRDLLLSREA